MTTVTVEHTNDNMLAEKVAVAFAVCLKSDMGEDNLREVVRRNATEEYLGSCATHDFLDANMVMADVLTRMFGFEDDLGNDCYVGLWNAAWDMAKDAKFYLKG